MKRATLIRLGAAVLVLGSTALGVVSWQHTRERRMKIAAMRPAPPDLRAWPDELRQRIARADGKNVASLAELSRLYHANGFLDEASRCYTALEQLEPREPRWLHRHATILAGRGDSEPALTRWRHVLELASDYAPARLRLADLLAKSEQPASAAEAYRAILQRAPDDPYATLGLARLDFAAERWQEARAKLESVVAKTNYDLGYDLIVTVYERLNQLDAAMAVRRRAKASGAFREAPDPWMDELMDECFDAYRLSLAAGVASRIGDKAKAARLLERAVALAPNDAAVRFQLAGVRTDAGDFTRARDQLVRCTQVAPTFPDAWAHLSALLARAGDRVGAERAVAMGLQRCPDSPGLHLMRARELRDAGRVVEAVAAYRTSIHLRPNEAEAYVELATTLFRMERVPEGLEQLHAALRAEPEHPAVLALLAFHAVNESDEVAAGDWIRRVRSQPRVPAEQVQRLRAAFRERFGREPPL